jgi:hypothetical protein
MNDKERAELEYYRQLYSGQAAPDPAPPAMPPHLASPYGAPAAQDALTEDELLAFIPDDLDSPKYQIAERHRRVYGGWNKKQDG